MGATLALGAARARDDGLDVRGTEAVMARRGEAAVLAPTFSKDEPGRFPLKEPRTRRLFSTRLLRGPRMR